MVYPSQVGAGRGGHIHVSDGPGSAHASPRRTRRLVACRVLCSRCMPRVGGCSAYRGRPQSSPHSECGAVGRLPRHPGICSRIHRSHDPDARSEPRPADWLLVDGSPRGVPRSGCWGRKVSAGVPDGEA